MNKMVRTYQGKWVPEKTFDLCEDHKDKRTRGMDVGDEVRGPHEGVCWHCQRIAERPPLEMEVREVTAYLTHEGWPPNPKSPTYLSFSVPDTEEKREKMRRTGYVIINTQVYNYYTGAYAWHGLFETKEKAQRYLEKMEKMRGWVNDDLPLGVERFFNQKEAFEDSPTAS